MDKGIKDPSLAKLADLFESQNKNVGYLSSSTTASFTKEIESSEFLEAYKTQEDRFIPQVNFESASNFARYGSAEEYYKDAFTRIYNQYPYDGSQKEKVLWDLSSSYLDKYIFENEYPRTTGYGTIGVYQTALTGSPAHSTYRSYDSSTKEYIFIKGGPNADPNGDWKSEIEAGQSIKGLSKTNIYDTGSFRESNLKLNFVYGNTIEFWLKKAQWANDDAAITGSAPGTVETIFDLWNSASLSDIGAGGTYARLSVYLRSSEPEKIFAAFQSGSNIAYYCPSGDSVWCAGGFDTGLTNIADDKWHHYALVTQNSGNINKSELYVDGALASTNTSGSDDHHASMGPVTGAFVAAVGSQVTRILYDNKGDLGWSKLSGSIDEFRFWKTARNAKQIGRFYKDQVYGGANTDLANTYLGVYYKFNEGITQTSSVDRIVLDYSGRISDGVWAGYSSTDSRSTSSAIVESGHASREFQDPIIYSFHSDVVTKLENFKIIGREHDFENGNSLINSLPAWISEDDYINGEGQLHKLTQILASYFDNLHLQIEVLPTIKNIDYASGSARPHFFNDRLLKDYGFNVDEILTDIDLFAYANTRDNKKLFEKKLYDVKNQIYKNIYNNLVHIYKTKGTKKSFRNVLRCIGIDEELIRLNLYGKNTNWQLQTNVRNVSSKSKYVDFYNKNNACVYGYPVSDNPNSKSYIAGSNNEINGIDALAPVTVETQILFPKYPSNESAGARQYTELTSSLFGLHTAKTALDTDTAWASNDTGSIQVYAIRKQRQTARDNPEVYFLLTGSSLGPITSSVYIDVYDNTEWNLSFRIKDTKYPLVDYITSSDIPVQVTAELVGYQHIGDTIINSFAVSGTAQSAYGSTFFSVPKRLYVGAHRTNFSGTLLSESDVFVSYARYWNTYLSNDILEYHAKNDASYGVEHPYRNTYLFQGIETTGLAKSEMPRISSLALNWDFSQVTASDASGQFSVADFSSGSDASTNYQLSSIVERQHTGQGDKFNISDTEVVEKKYVPSTRLVAPDQINSDDMVNIVDFEGEIFTRATRPVEYFYAFEKSMYANISDEMLNWFAGIKDFHNLIGNPVNKYRKSNKELTKIRELFFRRVDNIPDLDKFIEYFKWIDNSISTMLMNLVPATANMADNVRNMIESHVLERNKIETKYTNLNLQQPEPSGRIKAVNELLYNWKFGKAPYLIENLALFDTFETGFSEYLWDSASADCTRKEDKTADTWAVVLSGSGDGSDHRWVATDNVYQLPLKVSYSWIPGTGRSNAGSGLEGPYDPTGLCISAPESGDDLNFQYSHNGTSWLTASFHQGDNSWSSVASGDNYWRFNEVRIEGTGSVKLRWYQDKYLADSQDNWAIDNVSVTEYLPENYNCPWWHDRAERDSSFLTSGDSDVDTQRETIKRISNSDVSGSTYALRKFTRPYHFAVDRAQDFKIDNNKYNFVKTALDQSTAIDDIILQDVESFVDCADENELNVKRRLDFKANLEQSPIKGRNITPFTVYSSSVDTGYKTALSTFNDSIEINDNHRDVYGTETQETLQGPFTKIHVGGKKSRKVAPFTTTDRIEEYDLAINSSNLTLSKRAADDPKSKYFLDEIAKRPVVIKNIKSNTGSLYLGNYSKEYQIVQTVGANTQRGWLKDNFSNFTQLTAEVLNLSGNIDFNMMDRTGSSLQSVTIADRFSAPGSPEAMSPGYLDPASHTFSVYNSLNYRNLTVRKPKSWQTYGDVFNTTPGQDRALAGGAMTADTVPGHAVMMVTLTNAYLGTDGSEIGLTASNGMHVTFKEDITRSYLLDPTITYDNNGIVYNFPTRCSAYWHAGDCAAITPGAQFPSYTGSARSICNAINTAFDHGVLNISASHAETAGQRFYIWQAELGTAGNTTAANSFSGILLEGFFSGTNPSHIYESRPFGNPYDYNLRTLTTAPPLDILHRNPMTGYPLPGYDQNLSIPNGTVMTASIHKVNRNVRQNTQTYTMPDAVGTEIAINKPLFDNFFVQHAIPQSDRQYAWITASLSGNHVGPSIAGHLYYAGLGDGLTAPLGYSTKKDDLIFVSSSDFGSIYQALNNFPLVQYGYPAGIIEAQGGIPCCYIRDDFVGLNTNIYETMTASLNILGFQGLRTGYIAGFQAMSDAIGYMPWHYQGGLVSGSVAFPGYGGYALLNGIINHRQGPYGWPSWRQIRGGNHPIMRNHRLTNTFSAIKRKAVPHRVHGTDNKMSFTRTPILNFTESVVTVKHKPIQLRVRATQDLYKPNEFQDMVFRYTYGNNICSFANDRAEGAALNNYASWHKASRTAPPIYNSITSLYAPQFQPGAAIVSSLNPIERFESLRYTEVIWPRSRNTFLNRTRARNDYAENAGDVDNGYDRVSHRSFWRDRIEDRVRTNLLALNSQNFALSASNIIDDVNGAASGFEFSFSGTLAAPLSIWPLEGRWTGSFEELSSSYTRTMHNPPQNQILNSRDRFSGELFGGQTVLLARPTHQIGGNYAREMAWMTASCRYHGTDPWMRSIVPGSTSDTTGRILGYNANCAQKVLSPGLRSGSSNINWTTNIDRGRNPWYDSYEDYAADLSKIGKDYSVIPEFNISDHMPFYIVEKDSDFMSPIPSRGNFKIEGIINSASVNNQFYNDYSFSDFLKNFDIVVEDHKGLANASSVRFTCHGLKKLLPYNGFYPVNRTLQIAALLSQSLGGHVSGSQDIETEYLQQFNNPHAARMAGLMQPFFAPGILYNTIKSGIAVDWPIYTGSSPDTAAAFSAFTYLTASNYRLPFETLYDFSRLPIYNSTELLARRNKIYAVGNQENETFFTWDGKENHDLYRRAMDNFLAESVNLFVKNGKLTSWTSKPMSEISFKQDVTYQMSVDIEMVDNIMTEGAINSSLAYGNGLVFGGTPNYTASFYWRNCRGEIYGPSTAWMTGSQGLRAEMRYGERQDPAYAPYTPPYFYGKATVDLSYTNKEADGPSPSLGIIFSKMTASYYNNLDNIPTASYDTGSNWPAGKQGSCGPLAVVGGGKPLRTWVDLTSPAISTMMSVSSSLNLFGKKIAPLVSLEGDSVITAQPASPQEQEQWVISTKFECPVLSFNHYTDDSKARGMWNGYGNIPIGGRGLKVTVRDTEPSELGSYTSNSKSLLGEMFPHGTPKDQKIGQLPHDGKKSISECIVAIPYLSDKNLAGKFNCVFSKEDNKYFFPIFDTNIVIKSEEVETAGASMLDLVNQVQEQIDEQVEAHQASSVGNLKEKMRKFIFPPRYDFINNAEPAISPFVMFAFEFKHKFTREELQDIWQGVMPDIAMKVVPESSTLNIPCQEGHLMNEFWRKFTDETTSKNDINKITRNLRWMVFKVKQRARNKYVNITETETDNLSFLTNALDNYPDIDHKYSYNWPYDYCSLVELAKIETSVRLLSPDLPDTTPTPEDSFFESETAPELPEGENAYTFEPPEEEGTDF